MLLQCPHRKRGGVLACLRQLYWLRIGVTSPSLAAEAVPCVDRAGAGRSAPRVLAAGTGSSGSCGARLRR